uniref:Mediator of RNA polymerase II transcription subunit 31 n=1 Tax=Compsopogon caeruleus TaxID=31354 RepID=A0A7S1TBG4_9RHOD|mmetsp:Transcript_14931/g.30362  ORF Transcript_14931/g.30362 Transcript_14931/m.30362 type:complete len:124 (+) Transcript_14931:182-553(+)|eukprot:CAMPEP_0184677830 /NCGR_PEP_ID=MMETSP0312-20130426/429_1 /TAXON_ID=31354 /ORGANISM="Compsopogon coeruleus, Strain SAG 36.94" /LENGTH=123 /DNA_ID=CAMNT_0027125963 /DNA_START=125 /DNA_END=496 /DNA_ORIENTATION=-
MEATEDEKEIERFETELEFVQCLASPAYIHWLAQNRYFDDDSFLAYLNYLQYWRTQEYAKFIVFPHCLYFLRLLQQESFREAMKRNDYMLFVHQQQGNYWMFNPTMTERVEIPTEANKMQNTN